MIVSWCRDVGIELRLDQKDEGAFSDEVYDNADYDLFIWSWGGDIDPGFMLSTFTTRQIGGWGDSQYSNPEYDRLYVRQAQAFDPADPEDTAPRKAITDEMQKILYRDDPYIILWYNLNLQAFRTDTWRGYANAPAGEGAPFWNFMRATYVSLRAAEPRPGGDPGSPPRGCGGRAPWPPRSSCSWLPCSCAGGRRWSRTHDRIRRTRPLETERGRSMTELAALWPDDAIEAMHLAALALLERAGVRVESPAARELLLAAGCTLTGEDRVIVPRRAVEEALAACPREYVLAARDPERSLSDGPGPGRDVRPQPRRRP